jgi:pimeloyl-ACP methyl ester carboxylesterase
VDRLAVLNPGGPGQSGVDAVTEAGAGLDALGEGRFGVVSWDVRGSWRSAWVSCFPRARARARFWAGRPVPTTRRETRRYLAKTGAFARRCGARKGKRLLAHITTADTARDLEPCGGSSPTGGSPSPASPRAR